MKNYFYLIYKYSMILGREMTYLWRKLKFRILTFYLFSVLYINIQNFRRRNSWTFKKWVLKHYKKSKLLEDVFVYRKCVIIEFSDFDRSTTALFRYSIGYAWLCEKFKVNFEFTCDSNAKGTETFFENYIDVEQHRKKHPEFYKMEANIFDEGFRKINITRIGAYLVPPQFGHKILSKLSIRSDFEKHADEYIDLSTNEDWVAVHFRGTDIISWDKASFRYVITLESYIVYLKEVLDNHCRIFACSDQAQFIDKMNVAFPGRVFARDIQRSIDYEPLHKSKNDRRQKKDAFMDLLVLARAKLIYTTGSAFVDIVRFFNPKTKIVSLDGRKMAGNNYMPIPKKDLYDSLSRKK